MALTSWRSGRLRITLNAYYAKVPVTVYFVFAGIKIMGKKQVEEEKKLNLA